MILVFSPKDRLLSCCRYTLGIIIGTVGGKYVLPVLFWEKQFHATGNLKVN